MHNGSILLAEDDDGNILVAKTLLETMGHRYDVARTGVEAVSKRQQDEFALILMDVRMPELSGFDATRQIRQWESESGKQRIPIIGLTAKTLTGDKEQCLECGMDDYMAKPIDFGLLEGKLSEWLRKQVG